MANYPKCPYCGCVLPEFSRWEKKFCPNCEKKIHNRLTTHADGGSVLIALLRKNWVWCIFFILAAVLPLFHGDFISTGITLWFEGIIGYMLCTGQRNRLLRDRFGADLPSADQRAREIQIRKRLLRYYGFSAITYTLLGLLMLIFCAFVFRIPVLKAGSVFAFCMILLVVSMAGWNLLIVIFRLLTFRRKLPPECNHAPVSEPFSPQRKNKKKAVRGYNWGIGIFCFFLLLGILISWIGFSDLSHRKEHPEQYAQIPARIVSILETTDSDGDTDHTVYVAYTYEDTTYSYQELPYYNSSMEKGDPVTVTIKIDQPEDILSPPGDLLAPGIVIMLSGLIGLAIMIFLQTKSR